ncbi:MAG: FtsK/SpoIIIE domain-containing protein [Candidatus Nanosyncoccaceae bacterium]|jgi:hypothetical protein
MKKVFSLEDAFKSSEWQTSNLDYKVIIGQNINTGKLEVESLFRDGGLHYPPGGDGNFLVASANVSGTGAMNFIRVMLACLMHKHSPDEVRFIIANCTNDFLEFEDSPYLFCPIIKDEQELIEKSEWFSKDEIERRQSLIYKENDFKKYKNIMDFNSRTDGERLPILVFVNTMMDLVYMHDAISAWRMAGSNRRCLGYYYGLTKITSVHSSFSVLNTASKKVVFKLTDPEMSKELIGDNSALSLKGKGDMIYTDEDEYAFKDELKRLQAVYADGDFIAEIAKSKKRSR